jgi:hypothetical protein
LSVFIPWSLLVFFILLHFLISAYQRFVSFS